MATHQEQPSRCDFTNMTLAFRTSTVTIISVPIENQTHITKVLQV